jgi:hypothetical protein
MKLLGTAFHITHETAPVARKLFDEEFVPQLGLAILPLLLILIVTVIVNALEDRVPSSTLARRKKAGTS